MVYIRDNGGAYSDHGVDFIKVPDDLDREQVEIALLFRDPDSYRDEPYIIAVCDKVEWRADEGRDFFDWFDVWDFANWGEREKYDHGEDAPLPVQTVAETKHGKRYLTLKPIAERLSLPFVRRCAAEWRKDEHRESWMTESMYDGIDRLIDLAVKHGVWK